LRADRAKTTAYSATRLAFGARLDKAPYSCKGLSAFATASVGEIRVVKILPEPPMLLEIDENRLAPAFSIAQELDSWHVHRQVSIVDLSIALTPQTSSQHRSRL